MNAEHRRSLGARLLRECAAGIGVALVLAALVHWIAVGPAIRLLLGYLASGAMIGLGLWLERKSEVVRNYAQIPIAGGLAGVYFTTYAAHYFQSFAVIRPAWLAWLLLVLCAGLIAWFAVRRLSQILGGMAIVLAWFTVTIQPFLLFTHASHLILASLAVWLLVRQHWTATAVITLAAVYLGFLVWWPYSEGRLDPDRFLLLGEFWTVFGCFAACWGLFTWGAWRSTGPPFSPGQGFAFVTLNNALFYGTGALILPPRHPDWFWKFTVIFGVLLLGAGALAAKFPEVRRGYAVQGALLVTLGLASAFTGQEPSIMFAVVSAFCVLTSRERDAWFLHACACGAALLAVIFGWEAIHRRDSTGFLIGLFCGALLLFNAYWVARRREQWWRWAVAFFAALGLLIWAVTTFTYTPEVHRSPVFAIEAVILTASFAPLAIREIPYLAKAFILIAQIVWFMQIGSFIRPWWNPLVVVLATLWISYWWQTRGRRLMPVWELKVVQGMAAVATVVILFLWIEGGLSTKPVALAVTSLLALAWLLYALVIRDWFLAGCSQLFTATAVGEFIGQLSHSPLPGAGYALLPAIALLVQARIIRHHFTGTEWDTFARWLAVLYRVIGAVLFVVWVLHYIGPANRFLVLSLAGTFLLVWSIVGGRRGWLLESVFCESGALLALWLGWVGSNGFRLRDLFAFVLLLSYGVLARRNRLLPELILEIGSIVGLASVTWWVSLWAAHHFPPLPLAAVWAVVSIILFCFGWWLRDRLYRGVGWALLGCALLHMLSRHADSARDFRLGLLVIGLAFLVVAFGYARRPTDAAPSPPRPAP